MNPSIRRLNPELIKLLQQGQQARSQGQVAAARAAYNEVLKRDAEQPDALHLLGELAQSLGRLTEAEELLVRSLRASPGRPQGWSRLGSVQEDLGRWADAQAAQRAVELKPDHVEAHYNRARLLRQLGDPAAAAQSVSEALRHNPAAPTLLAQTLQLRAQLEEDAGQLEAALATLQLALAVTPQRAALHHNRGVLLHRLARPARPWPHTTRHSAWAWTRLTPTTTAATACRP